MASIEELTKLNKALQESNKQLMEELERKDALINNLPCTVSWINKDLEYLSINKELEELFDIGKGTFKRKKVGFLNKENNPFQNFMESLFAGSAMYGEVEFSLNVNGMVRHQLVMAQKYKGEEEAVVIGFDTTEKVKLKEKIDDGEKLRLIGELATGIVHEVKNPLSVILGNAEIAMDRLESQGAEAVEYSKKSFDRILKMTDRIDAIINGLKNLARDHSNDEKEPSSFFKILDESLLICKNKLTKYAARLEIDNSLDPEEDLMLPCIEGQIIQVIVNVVGNAAEANMDKDDNWVKLLIGREGNDLVLRVIDPGKGISEEVLEKIFEPFFTTKPKGIGTGMGLGICQRIVEEHDGELKYELFEGNTSFLIKLPLT